MMATEEVRSKDAARRLAEELEATGVALVGDPSVEMLVKAADIRRRELSDSASAMVLLRRVLKDSPRSHLAIGAALDLADEIGAYEDLTEILALAARATATPAARARLIARRADVLATKLGRIAEARSSYRDAAQLAARTPLGSAADAAADRIDQRLREERDGRPSTEPLSVVDDGPLRFGESAPIGDDPSAQLEQLREEIGAHAPLDHVLVLKAVRLGLAKGLDDVAVRILPWMSKERRSLLLEEIAVGADGAQDPDAARDARAAAFFDAPHATPNFDALMAVSIDSGDSETVARTIERRASAVGPSGLLDRANDVTDEQRRARVLVELVRHAQDIDALDAALEASEALAAKLRSPRQLARVLSAGASHAWLPGTHRGAILLRLARVLEKDLEDVEGAKVVQREANAMMVRGADTQPDTLSPLYSTATSAPSTDATTMALADEVEALASRELHRGDDDRDPRRLAARAAFKEAISALVHVSGPERAAMAVCVARMTRMVRQFDDAAQALMIAWSEADDEAKTMLMREAAALAVEGGPWLSAILASDQAMPSNHEVQREIGLAAAVAGQDEIAERYLSAVCAEDPEDEEALTAFVGRTDREDIVALVETLPAAAVEVARHYERRGDPARAYTALDNAMRLNPGRVDVAKAAFDLAASTRDDARVDEALRHLRLASFERGEWTTAFIAAALLVARSVDEVADRMTYQLFRHDVVRSPKAPLPNDWLADLDDRLGASVPSSPALNSPRKPLTTCDAGLMTIDAVRVAFGLSNVLVCEAADGRVRVEGGPSPVVFVSESLAAYPRRLRFDVARGMAALADPRLRPGLDFVNEADETPPATVSALDRAGLILASDPAVALAEVGPRTARGLELTTYAVSDALRYVWRAMGLGLA